MDFENYEDDFNPIEGNFAAEASLKSDQKDDQLTAVTHTEQKSEQLTVSEKKHNKAPEHKSSKKISKGAFFRVLGIAALVLVVIFVFSVNDYFKNYKTNFVMNIKAIDAKFEISESLEEIFGSDDDDFLKRREEEENKATGTTYDNESYLIPFENASDAQFSVASEGVIVAKSNYLACLNDTGKELWSLSTSVVNPILAVDGKYMAVAENGGTKVCLYIGNKLIFASDAQNEILNANVSSEGDVVVVTKKEFFKGAVEVFNKNGERIFSWSSGSDTVMCADISPSSRRIAVGFLNSKDNIIGSVQLFNINETESYKTIEIPETVVFELKFIGETLNVIGDNRIVGLSVHGSVIWDETFDGDFSAFSVDAEGNKAAVIDEHNHPVIKIYSKKGKERKNFDVEELPDYVDISENYLLYNNTRMIVFRKNNNIQKYAAAMDVKGLKIINDDTYLIVYSNSLEFVCI